MSTMMEDWGKPEMMGKKYWRKYYGQDRYPTMCCFEPFGLCGVGNKLYVEGVLSNYGPMSYKALLPEHEAFLWSEQKPE